MKKFLLFLVAVLLMGLTAQATLTEPVTFKGLKQTVNNTSYFSWEIRSVWGQASLANRQGSSYTFSNTNLGWSPVNASVNGTLNFQEATSPTDVITSGTFTVTFNCTTLWFDAATVKTGSGGAVTGCTVTVSSDKHTVTVTIPSGKTFGQIALDYVPNAPMTSSNTTIGGIAAEYIYRGNAIEPVPTVTSGGRTLTAGTDYTVSYSGNNSVGTATLTVTGTGNYTGTVTKNYTIRNIALSDFRSLGSNTYEIATTTDLDNLAALVDFAENNCSGLTFRQTADIAYSTTGLGDTGENFTTIGGYFNGSDKSFCGTYDGQGHTISGIRLYKPLTNQNVNKNQALFGRTINATIKDVTLTDARITGYRIVGGIVGYCEGCTVQNCLVLNSTVTCGDTYVGALIARNQSGNTFTANYYHNCTVNGTAGATNVGVGGNGGVSASSDRNGTRSVHALTLPDGVTATGESVTIGSATYYAAGTTVTLAYANLPEHSIITYSVNGNALTGNTFTMPAADATVIATVESIPKYTFDRTTGALTLNWGEYNKDNKWGSEVVSYVVNSVTATSEVSFTGDCSGLFYNFKNCVSMDLNNVNTSEMTNCNQMFKDCMSLTSLDLSGWNTGGVTDMGEMFNYCKGLTSLDLSGWNTESVTTMYDMFTSCSGLTSLNLTNFNTANVTSMNNMFCFCSGLTSLGLSGFNTEGVTDMGSMFRECSSLTSLDLSGFNTAKVTNMTHLFYQCSSLATIYASAEWSTARVDWYNGMFFGCTALVGGSGTTFDSSQTDKTYARIDKGDDEPGYLTGVFTLTVGEDVSATATATLTHGDLNLYAAGTTVTLAYHGQGVESTHFTGFAVNGTPIEGNTFEMPLEDVIVTAVILPHYTYDSATGTLTLNWGEFNKDNMWGGDVPVSAVKSVTATSEVIFTGDCSGLFYNFNQCDSMVLNNVNTSEMTNCNQMFQDCSSLTSLDVTGWNTEGVTNMSFMFDGCLGLTSLDVSGFNTDSVTDMIAMFRNCSALTSLDVSGFNTEGVTNMSSIFSGCRGLTSLDVSGFNTANVTDMSSMFIYCSGLDSLDVSGFNTGNVTNMSSMFEGCPGLDSLDVSGFNTGNVTNMSGMFYGCSGLDSLDVSGFNTANVRDMGWMFKGCSGLTSLDLSGWNTANVDDMNYMFDGCSGLTSLDVSGFNTANVYDMSWMFEGCSGLTSLDHSRLNTGNVQYMQYMFNGCSGLTTIYAGDDWSTDHVGYHESSHYMFFDCTRLVGGMGTTYHPRCTNVEYAHIDGGPDDPGYFTYRAPRYTFDSETGALTLNWGEFNKDNKWGDDVDASSVKSVTATSEVCFTGDCSNLFYYFNNCVSMNLNNVNTSQMTKCIHMFDICQSLTSLDLSGWNTSNVTNMNYMFVGCTGLTSIDLSGWNTGNVIDMSCMFFCCSNLTTIYAGAEWSTEKVRNSKFMFEDCYELKGGMGTAYDENYTDKTYAHIDGGPSNPGYFTAKSTALRGDVNGDGDIGIADVTALIDYILSGDASDINLDAADCDQNGEIGISDVTTLIDYILNGNW